MEAEGRSGWGWLTQGRLALLIIFLVLVIDQWIKIAVKTHMYLHESIRVTDWFYILFTENPGMAFGWEFFDKLFLTSFRSRGRHCVSPLQVDTQRRAYGFCRLFVSGFGRGGGKHHRLRVLRIDIQQSSRTVHGPFRTVRDGV
jgi:hypothetical protein